ncbi:sulfite exporter TauE/SafE family protein [Porphyromonas sp.]|uniref:sulfite exporter TauE/SafE family protein n=1 Tax=Porphyromonas sp. TaxID=1924944 RepID=UPI0026DD275F|nr:sulfite exporter TauE/SafE family protein [Porphyromonas sp.]MDO4770882.1 sulfite exporter TauE/SafE family protein [Porphyromonas sp.]
MYIVGYLASILIGLSLGLIGGGGSILTVPVLVYLFGIDPVLGTAYSLFIVGITSVIGSVSYFRRSLVDIRTAVIFGLPSIVAVYLTRAYLVPAIPQEVFSVGGFIVDRSMLLMLIFAILMLVASVSMIKPTNKQQKAPQKSEKRHSYPYALILLEGTVVGALTGLVGAGGGFLIIPALVILGGLPMKQAIGTSLVIISAKSLLGFLGESGLASLDWGLLFSVTAFAIFGIFLGMKLSERIDGAKLKPAFGWFVFVMGLYIILKETVLA